MGAGSPMRERDQFLRSIRLDRASVPSFQQFPFSLPVVHHLERLTLHPHVTFLVGDPIRIRETGYRIRIPVTVPGYGIPDTESEGRVPEIGFRSR